VLALQVSSQARDVRRAGAPASAAVAVELAPDAGADDVEELRERQRVLVRGQPQLVVEEG
jgi:hypothetical protein